ncbi:transposase [Methylococcaceae bacterium WWC4]|nr:transposase [Methylococcaceae bacterium WWC4]
MVDLLLSTLNDEFNTLCARRGQDSIPPERLLRTRLQHVLFSIRPERQLAEHIDFNLLYRWFVGLTMDDEVWDHSTFSANRDRLLNERISRLFFERVPALADWQKLLSDDHFSVDGTLIQVWALLRIEGGFCFRVAKLLAVVGRKLRAVSDLGLVRFCWSFCVSASRNTECSTIAWRWPVRRT